MSRGTPPPVYLRREDEERLKVLLQYAFADPQGWNGLTEVERSILGSEENYTRLVDWACEGQKNPYVTGKPLTESKQALVFKPSHVNQSIDSLTRPHWPYSHAHKGEELGDGHQHTDPDEFGYIKVKHTLMCDSSCGEDGCHARC